MKSEMAKLERQLRLNQRKALKRAYALKVVVEEILRAVDSGEITGDSVALQETLKVAAESLAKVPVLRLSERHMKYINNQL